MVMAVVVSWLLLLIVVGCCCCLERPKAVLPLSFLVAVGFAVVVGVGVGVHVVCHFAQPMLFVVVVRADVSSADDWQAIR